MSTVREFPGESRYVVTAPVVMAHCGNSWQLLFDGTPVPSNIDPVQRERLIRLRIIQPMPEGTQA